MVDTSLLPARSQIRPTDRPTVYVVTIVSQESDHARTEMDYAVEFGSQALVAKHLVTRSYSRPYRDAAWSDPLTHATRPVPGSVHAAMIASRIIDSLLSSIRMVIE